MRKLIPWVLVAVVVAGVLFFARSRRPGAALATQTFQLPNGLAVELVTGPCGESAAATLLFAVGENHDPAGHSGLIRIIERLLGSTEAVVRASTDHLEYSVTAPREKILSVLDALATRVSDPAVTEAAFATAKAQVLSDIALRNGGNALLAAVTDASEALLPSAGMGRRGGIASEVESVDLATLKAFWSSALGAGNARLVVVGDLDAQQTRTRLEQAFGKLARGTPPILRPPRDMTVTGTLVMGDAPAAVALVVRPPSFKDAAFPAFLVLANRLLKNDDQAWAASYDPMSQPELLVVAGPLRAGEPAEPGAARIRQAALARLDLPLSAEEATATAARFDAFLWRHDHDAAACQAGTYAPSLALARRAQLSFDPAPIAEALKHITPAQVKDAAGAFAPAKTAAVIAGGTVR